MEEHGGVDRIDSMERVDGSYKVKDVEKRREPSDDFYKKNYKIHVGT